MLTQRISLSAQNLRKVSTTKVHRLGTIAETADGRIYRYARAGGANLTNGNLQINTTVVANHTNRTVAAAAAIGATKVSVNLGATAATQDQYADGFLTVNDATGEGIQYGVQGNAANAGSLACDVLLFGDEPLQAALVASTSEVTLKKNNWADTILSATGQADLPVGVPNVTVTAGSYYWAQTGGECSVLADASTMTKGVELTISAATAGAVGLKDAAGEVKVGVASEALVSTENRAAYLTIN